MLRSLLFSLAVLLPSFVSAQLMLPTVPQGGTEARVNVETRIPQALAGDTKLQFTELEMAFDGGSYGAFFKRENGSELVLFFPNPSYWTVDAKKAGRQPVAIQGKTLTEISPGSPLENRLLELLASDIADGGRDRQATLTLIRLRDCLLSRRPLAEFQEKFDPQTWEARQ